MRYAVIPALLIVLVLGSGCAGRYGVRHQQGRLLADSEHHNRLVYLMTGSDYDRLIVPRLKAGGNAIANFLATQRSSLVADGRPVIHEAGNYKAIHFCNGTMRVQDVQIIADRTLAATPAPLHASCPK